MIPGGVVTCQVSAVPSTVGPVVSSTATITPTQDLIWSATGQRLAQMCNTYPAPGWVTLPACDQMGFITPDTHISVIDWSYLITVNWTEADGSQHSESGQITCLTSQAVEYLIDMSGVLQTPSPGFPGTAVAVVVMTSAQYSALSSPDPFTLYITY
jgi:hypothetical protein